MDAEYEERWCKYCMIKTKQEIIFMPEIPTYKRRRQYKCTQCGKKYGCKVEDHLQNQFIDQKCDQKYYFLKKACAELHQLV